MGSYKINLKDQPATSINDITFKLTETNPGEYEGVCLNPKDIPPDDLVDKILSRMVKEAGNREWRLELPLSPDRHGTCQYSPAKD
jgi:hypothetical protein